MHQLIPTILKAPTGELGLFARGARPDGMHAWDVARPIAEGWEAIGSVHQVADGYRGRGPFELRTTMSVSDAAATLARLAAEYDAKHDYRGALDTVPAHDVGPGGRIYAEATA